MSIISKFSSHKFLFLILIGVLAFFIAFGMLYRTSSQGDSAETYPKGFRGGACTIETENLIIGYSGYYLPADFASPENTLRSPYVPVQCGNVPEPATLNISIDLLYPESARDFLLAQRLVKVEAIDNNQKEQKILSISAQQHPSGVITQAFKLNEPGQYILYLEGKNIKNTNIQVKIPIKVGSDWKDHFKKLFSTFLRKD